MSLIVRVLLLLSSVFLVVTDVSASGNSTTTSKNSRIVEYQSLTKSRDSVITDSMLRLGSRCDTISLLNNPTVSYCANTCVKRRLLSVSLDAYGDAKEYLIAHIGNFRDSVNLTATLLKSSGTAVSGSFHACMLLVNQDTVESRFVLDITEWCLDVCNNVKDGVSCAVSLSNYASTLDSLDALARAIRVRIEITDEISKDVVTSESDRFGECTACDKIQLRAESVTGTNPVTFAWGPNVCSGFTPACPCQNDSFPNYQLQYLRVFNVDKTLDGDANIEAVVDWGQATTVETYGPAQFLTLTVPDGSGYYLWRVRPIGDRFQNAIGNDSNWGCWSLAPPQGTILHIANYRLTSGEMHMPPGSVSLGSSGATTAYNSSIFFYDQFDEDINWIYSRVFTEGKDSRPGISESMKFANGLLQVGQQQVHVMSIDSVLASSTLYDYTGRVVGTTLAAPVQASKLQYFPGLAMNGAALYRAKHFDREDNFQSPLPMIGPISEYYSNANPDLTIPTADSLPFTRKLFDNDPTARIRELGDLGKIRGVGGGRTVRSYISSVADQELISVFGDEAPCASSLIKTITFDQNNVGSVAYATKDGHTVVTCLVRDLGANADSLLMELPEDDTVNHIAVLDTLTGNVQQEPYLISAGKSFVLTKETTLNISYELLPKKFEMQCDSFCQTCDYKVHRLIKRLDPDSVVYKDSLIYNAAACSTLSAITSSATITVPAGTYVIQRYVTTNNTDALTNLKSIEKHQQALRALKNSEYSTLLNSIFTSTFLEHFHDPHYAKSDAFYDSLLSTYYTYLRSYTAANNTRVQYFNSCDSIILPVPSCTSCLDTSGNRRNFEVALAKAMGDTTLGATDIELNRYFRNKYNEDKYQFTSSQHYGYFNTLISNMILAGFDCDKLWRCWESIINSYKAQSKWNASLTPPTTQVGVDLLEEFLECAGGAKYCSATTEALDSASGYLTNAWRIVGLPYPSNPELDSVISRVGYNPSDTNWICNGQPYRDSLVNDHYLKLRRAIATYQDSSHIDDATGNTAVRDSIRKYMRLDSTGMRAQAERMTRECIKACDARTQAYQDTLLKRYHEQGFTVEGFDDSTYCPTCTVVHFTQVKCLLEQIKAMYTDSCQLRILTHAELNGDSVADGIGPASHLVFVQKSFFNPFDIHIVSSSGSCTGDGIYISRYTKIGQLAVDELNYYLGKFRESMTSAQELWNYSSYWNDLVSQYPALGACGAGDRQVFVMKDGSSHFTFETIHGTGGDTCKLGYSGEQYGLQNYTPLTPNPLVDKLNSLLDSTFRRKIAMSYYANSPLIYKAQVEHDTVFDCSSQMAFTQYYLLAGRYDTSLIKKFYDTTSIFHCIINRGASYKLGQLLPTITYSDVFAWDIADSTYNPNGDSLLLTQRLQLGIDPTLFNIPPYVDHSYFGIPVVVPGGTFDCLPLFVNDRGNIECSSSMCRASSSKCTDLHRSSCADTTDCDSVLFRVKIFLTGNDVTGLSRALDLRAASKYFSTADLLNIYNSGYTAVFGKFIQHWTGRLAYVNYFHPTGCAFCVDVDTLLIGTAMINACNGGCSGPVGICSVSMCDSTTCGSLCFRWLDVDTSGNQTIPPIRMKSCAQVAMEEVIKDLESQLYNQILPAKIQAVETKYQSVCANADSLDDHFVVGYGMDLYHYTLYYYDRAGNLVRTVPPAGVRFWTTGHRDGHPIHDMVTTYDYNGFKQLVHQETPDGGATDFWNNAVGQVRLSRSAQQAADNKYSYTKYDNLSRIVEVGEFNSGVGDPQAAIETDATFPTSGCTYKTCTTYSQAYSSGLGYTQHYLLNRVSYALTDVDGNLSSDSDQVTSIYSYDPHGDVEWVMQKIPQLGSAITQYEYDLISGKVTQVSYQPGKTDSYYHRYTYDADNRLSNVQTSRDSVIWDTDARYTYYAHGPLRRTVLGQDKIQGVDNVYTIQGWLKGINHQDLTSTTDPGGDGSTSTTIPRDAFGMTLGYYTGDFTRYHSTTYSPYNSAKATTSDPLTYSAAARSLYNGNITNWALNNLTTTGTSTTPLGAVGTRYTYDRLNRIKADSNAQWTSGAWDWTDPSYLASRYSYDPNGNIKSLSRKDASSADLDRFCYEYVNHRNQLAQVSDSVGATSNTLDLEGGTSYTYDYNGRLTQENNSSTGAVNITWSPYNKPVSIENTNTGCTLRFLYDAGGNRVLKAADYSVSGDTSLAYVRNAQGHVMTVYKATIDKFNASEYSLYGISRLGMGYSSSTFGAARINSYINVRFLRAKQYQENDHLADVRTIISDVKSIDNSSNIYNPEIVSYQNYYPYGMMQQDRANGYTSERYGYSGKEKDDEVSNVSSSYNYGARDYDARIARFISVDSLESKYPSLSGYSIANNNPIYYLDADGREIRVSFAAVDSKKIPYMKTVKYANGKLFNLDGSSYKGNNSFAIKVRNDLNKLSKYGGELARRLQVVETSDQINTISMPTKGNTNSSLPIDIGKNRDHVPTGSTVKYDPDNKKNADGENRAPVVGLAHELLGHSYDYNQGIFTWETRQGLSMNEIRAVQIENEARKHTGEAPRTHYGPFPIAPADVNGSYSGETKRDVKK